MEVAASSGGEPPGPTPLAALGEPALQFLRSVQLMVKTARDPQVVTSKPADFFEAAKMAHNDFKFLHLLACRVQHETLDFEATTRTIQANLVSLVRHLRDSVEASTPLDSLPPPVGEAIWFIAESVKQIVAAAQSSVNQSAPTAEISSPNATAAAQPQSPSASAVYNAASSGVALSVPEQQISPNNTPKPSISPPMIRNPALQTSPPMVPSLPALPAAKNHELELAKIQNGVKALSGIVDIFFGENRGQSRSRVAPAAAELTKHSFELQVAAKSFGMQEYAVKLMERTTDVLFGVKQVVATRERPEALAALDESTKLLANLFKEFVRAAAMNGVSLISSVAEADAQPAGPAAKPNSPQAQELAQNTTMVQPAEPQPQAPAPVSAPVVPAPVVTPVVAAPIAQAPISTPYVPVSASTTAPIPSSAQPEVQQQAGASASHQQQQQPTPTTDSEQPLRKSAPRPPPRIPRVQTPEPSNTSTPPPMGLIHLPNVMPIGLELAPPAADGSSLRPGRPVSGGISDSSTSEGDDTDEEEVIADIMDTLEEAFDGLTVDQDAPSSPNSSGPDSPSVSRTSDSCDSDTASESPKPVSVLSPGAVSASLGASSATAPRVTTSSSPTPAAATTPPAAAAPAPEETRRRRMVPVPPKRPKPVVVEETVNLSGPMPTPAPVPTQPPVPIQRKNTKTTKALKQFLNEAARPTAHRPSVSPNVTTRVSPVVPVAALPTVTPPPPKTGADILNLWDTLEQMIAMCDIEKMMQRARWDLHNQRKEERANRNFHVDPDEEKDSVKSKGSSFSLLKRFMGQGSSDKSTSAPKKQADTRVPRSASGMLQLSTSSGTSNSSGSFATAASSMTSGGSPTSSARDLSWQASRGSLRRPMLSVAGLEDVADPRVEKFEAPDTDDVIRFSDNEKVIGGTIEKLIQRLTFDGHPDPQFVQSFLMTYRTFLTPRELLSLLELRWNSRPPAERDLETFCKERMFPIRLRVFNALKTWVEKFFRDFKGDNVMIEQLREFAKRMERAGMPQPASQLLATLDRKIEGVDLLSESFAPANPPPIFSPTGIKFRDFHPIEVARQLTLMESKLFRAIEPHELLDVSWTKKDKETRSPNVLAMIRFSNHVISWVCTEIVTPEDLRDRSIVLNRFIAIAQAALQLNNFNAAMEVVSALHNSSVYRLQSTWNMLPDESWTAFESLERLFESDDNYKSYRAALERCVPPCVPYLGRYLSDLLFIEEKHERMLADNLINFGKLDTIASTIGSVELQQENPFVFQEVPEIASYIKNFTVIGSEREMYNISLQREARKAK